MEDKIAVILTGGYSPGKGIVRQYTDKADYIVAADSGFDIACENDINVNFVLGDMDSIKEKGRLAAIPRTKKMIVSHEKDETDTELALERVWDLGYRNIVLIGGGGGRLDHIIGILWLFERTKRPKLWVTDNETVQMIDHEISCKAEIGERLSFFPISDTINGLFSEGLKWNLTGLQWKRGDIGISNEAVDTLFRISLKSGKILLIRKNKKGVCFV